MIRVLFYRVVLTVTVSILFFILGELSIDSYTPWLNHQEGRQANELARSRLLYLKLTLPPELEGRRCSPGWKDQAEVIERRKESINERPRHGTLSLKGHGVASGKILILAVRCQLAGRSRQCLMHLMSLAGFMMLTWIFTLRVTLVTINLTWQLTAWCMVLLDSI